MTNGTLTLKEGYFLIEPIKEGEALVNLSTELDESQSSALEYFGIKMHNAHKLLPKKVLRVHGCLGCEWKGKKDKHRQPLCPFDFRLKTNTTGIGTCPRRAVYLLRFANDPENIKSYTEWQRSYNNSIAQTENMNDMMEIEDLRNDIDRLKEDLEVLTDPDEIKSRKKQIKDKQTELYYARTRWEGLVDKVMKYSDKKLDRETAKKIDLTSKSIKPSDIAAAIRGAEQIVEGEIINEDE